MKTYLLGTIIAMSALAAASPLFAARSIARSHPPQVFAESEEGEDEGPSEATIRKCAAMTPDQTFKREGTKESDGKIAPKDATLYIIDINDKDGKTLFKTFFFKGENGKWSLFDEAGNVMHET